jgi:hypothetical protein
MISIHACKTSVGRVLRSESGAARISVEKEEGRGVVRNSWNQYVGIMEVKLMKRLGSVAWVVAL